MTPGAALVGWLVVWLVLAQPVASASAEAGPPRTDAPPATEALVLAVRIDPALAYRDFGPALLEHLRAELVAGKVVVVPEDAASGPTPNAHLTVSAIDGSPRTVALDVQFLRSGTSVRHVVDLSSLPADGAALAIAIAVDELIRATWSLSGVATVRPEAAPPPPAAAATPAPRPARAEARLFLSAARSGDGTLSLGPDGVVVFLLGSRVGVEARAGWRASGARAAPDGSIDVSAVTAGLGASVALPARAAGRRAGAELGMRLDGAWVRVKGAPSSGATALTVSVLGAAAVAGVSGWVTVAEPLRLVAFAGWQVPLRAVRAVDGNRFDVRVYDAGPSAGLGIGARF